MGKFGKKVVVDVDMSKYIIGLLAPSGFGKSTLLSRVAEKEFGNDGYIALDLGQEDGYATISGAIVERCIDFAHFKEVIDDIVMNKQTDYPALKVVILDTIDATYEIAEKYTIKSYNREHMNDKDFKKAMSINSVEGGFGRGLDRCIDTVKEQLARLKSVGVGFWYAGHCKEKETTDMITGNSMTQLTTSMTAKYFNSIKDISHIVGFGYYDRSFEHVEIGRENPVTKKKKSRDNVTEETRKIKFRDDGFLMDAKSRFPEIISEIELNRDQFIKAIKDAITAAGGSPVSNATAKKIAEQKIEDEHQQEREEQQRVFEEEEREEEIRNDSLPFDIDDEPEETINRDVLINEIKIKFSQLANDDPVKKEIKKMLIEGGDGKLAGASTDLLDKINSML